MGEYGDGCGICMVKYGADRGIFLENKGTNCVSSWKTRGTDSASSWKIRVPTAYLPGKQGYRLRIFQQNKGD